MEPGWASQIFQYWKSGNALGAGDKVELTAQHILALKDVWGSASPKPTLTQLGRLVECLEGDRRNCWKDGIAV